MKLSDMMFEAYDLGLSSRSELRRLHLASADHDALLSEAETRSGDMPNLVDAALGSLVLRNRWPNAKRLIGYSYEYPVGNQGLDWHDDTDCTEADLLVIHTAFGAADLEAIRSDGSYFNDRMGEGSVIVIKVGTLHKVSGPIGGPRQVDGYPIALA